MHLIAQTVTYDNGGSGLFSGVGLFVWLAFLVLYIVGGWKVFEKAGEAGWKFIIPIYNLYILLKIVGRPGWWLILYFIPFVNIVILIIVWVDLSKSFGHGVGFALGLIFLPYIFLLILGFGSDRYLGPAASGGASAAGGGPPMPPAPV
jgi:Family of unknown function (DUF5684)